MSMLHEPVDFLHGRDADVHGKAFVYNNGTLSLPWASVLVELDIQLREIDRAALDERGELVWGAEYMPEQLGFRALRPAATVLTPPEPDGPLRWSVQLRDRPGRASGIYGPSWTGAPSKWVLMSPMVPTMPAWLDLAAGRNQVAVYVTYDTVTLSRTTQGQVFVDRLHEVAARGALFGAAAAVLP